jgi:hypothetical protein
MLRRKDTDERLVFLHSLDIGPILLFSKDEDSEQLRRMDVELPEKKRSKMNAKRKRLVGLVMWQVVMPSLNATLMSHSEYIFCIVPLTALSQNVEIDRADTAG